MRKPRTDFRRDEDGATAVEFVLWLPAFMLILAFILDITLSMVAHSLMWDVARDTVRQLSIGKFTASQAVGHAETAAALHGKTPVVSANDIGPQVWVNIEVPVADVTFFNMLGLAGSERLSARAVMMQEPL